MKVPSRRLVLRRDMSPLGPQTRLHPCIESMNPVVVSPRRPGGGSYHCDLPIGEHGRAPNAPDESKFALVFTFSFYFVVIGLSEFLHRSRTLLIDFTMILTNEGI